MSDEWGIDGGKLHLHPERVAQWMAADTWEKAKKVAPLYWEITTSAACSHRCTFCSTDALDYPNDFIDAAILCERMDEAHSLGVKSVMFAGSGEPLLHKRISAITESAFSSGLDVAFTTNGVLLGKLETVARCTWIKVSLNAGKQETYAKVHRTNPKDWDRVWNGIRGAVKRKGNCTIGVQAVVLPENVYEMRDLANLCIDAGVEYLVLKPYSQATFMLSHQYEKIDYAPMREYLALVAEMSTKSFKVIYRKNAISDEIGKKHSYDKCRATPSMWVYSKGDGDVISCSAHLMDPRFNMGNMNKHSFQEIWEGEKRRENWELMQGFDIKQCRLNCRMNSSNKYMHQILHAPHANFI